MKPSVEIDAVFEVPHPFVHQEDYLDRSEYRWKPGTRPEDKGTGIVIYRADGKGFQILRVVGIFEPKGFHKRVFYTRRWRDPDGKEFGKRGCRVLALGAFSRLIQGYRYNDVEMTGAADSNP